MAVQIELFQSFKRFNRMTGIHPSKPNQKYSSKLRSAVILLPLILANISSTAYLTFEAEAVAEYAQSFYISASELCFTIDFLAVKWGMKDIIQLIEIFQKFIQKSKLYLLKFEPIEAELIHRNRFLLAGPVQSKYKEINVKIERISKFFHFLLTKFTVAVIIFPCAIITIVNYFYFDLGNDSFYLPYSLM